MVMVRLNQQVDRALVQKISQLENDLADLKGSPQFTEPVMYEYSSANSYDLTGSLGSSAGSNQLLAQFLVTATSVDGIAFISTFVPQIWIPNLSTSYHDTMITDYQILYNRIVSDDVTKTQYWLDISARNAVSASTFYFKALIYSTTPVTVTFARLV